MALRKLTSNEINDILSFITCDYNIPEDTKKSIINKHISMLTKQLQEISINPKAIGELTDNIKKQYFRSLITPGDNIGIESGQNIGREQTQTTLDSFHKAGSTGRLLGGGISRFNELLSMTKEPKLKSHKISLNENYIDVKDVREDIGNSLININFKFLIKDYRIFSDKSKVSTDWYYIFENIYTSIPDNIYCITYLLDVEKLYTYKIQLETLIDKIEKNITDNIICVFSPLYIGEIHIYFDIDGDSLDDTSNDFIYNYIFDISTNIIEKIYISGIEGINNVYYFKENDRWMIETEGSNFKKILSLDKVDIYNTISTNPWDMYNVLGIEATREYLIEEISSIMSDVNKCHIELLVDVMTYSGTLTSISRHSMNRDHTGPIAKGAFEEVLQNFQSAAINSEIDNTNSITSSIMYGKLSPFGTGSFDIIPF